MFEFFFLLSFIAGQLIKIPFWGYGGLTLLDLFVFFISLLLLWRLKLKLNTPPLFISASIIFIFFASLSLLLSPLDLSPTETFISFSYTVRFFVYILFGWLLYSSKFLKISNDFFIKAGLILAVLGLMQLILLPDLRELQNQGWDPHYFRTVSTYLDPNFLGAFLVLSLMPLTRKKLTLITTACFVLIFMALLTTFSRSSYLAFGVAFLSLSFLNKSKKLLCLTIVLIVLLFLGFSTYQKLVSTPRNINRDQSAGYRINSWEHGWEIFQKNPILGIGFNAYRFALSKYSLAPEQFVRSHGASSNDSSLLFVAATTGIFGLVSYLFFLLTMAMGSNKNFIFLSGLAALIVQSFFANILFYPFILIWIILNAGWKKAE